MNIEIFKQYHFYKSLVFFMNLCQFKLYELQYIMLNQNLCVKMMKLNRY